MHVHKSICQPAMPRGIGPLVVAGVLLDYAALRGHCVRPLAALNDSKQVALEDREMLFSAVTACATRISVRRIGILNALFRQEAE